MSKTKTFYSKFKKGTDKSVFGMKGTTTAKDYTLGDSMASTKTTWKAVASGLPSRPGRAGGSGGSGTPPRAGGGGKP